MINEIKDSVKNAMHERMNSPILGTFLIFTVSINWKVFVVFFTSDAHGMERVFEIERAISISGFDFNRPISWTVISLAGYPMLKLIYTIFNMLTSSFNRTIIMALERADDYFSQVRSDIYKNRTARLSDALKRGEFVDVITAMERIFEREISENRLSADRLDVIIGYLSSVRKLIPQKTE